MVASIPQMEPWFDESEARSVSEYILSGGWLTEHHKTAAFEKEIAKYTQSNYCVVTTNGTVTLILALLSLQVKPQDEILVPNITMIATANACRFVGALPVFVDVEKDTLCMDLVSAQKKLTKRTKALMYVSLNGRSGDMKKVQQFCKTHHLYLIEDAAQSLGSFYQKRHLGTFGNIGSFSFSVPKIITTGQGGALVMGSKLLYKRIKLLKDFGRAKGGIDIHTSVGWNFKFTDVQAVIGLEQMKKLSWRVQRKKQIYQRYYDQLCKNSQIQFLPTNLTETCPWFVDIFVSEPKKLAAYLETQGISTRLFYPPLTSQRIYRGLGSKKTLPVSYMFALSGLWLPSSSKLTDTQIDTICQKIQDYYAD